MTSYVFAANVNGDEVIRKPSRNDNVKADTRRLKTVTLDRVGRMFKSRGQTCEVDKAEVGLDNAMVRNFVTYDSIFSIINILCNYEYINKKELVDNRTHK